MRPLLALILLGSFAYVGTMIDNLFAFAAQLTLTPRELFSRVTSAQSTGVVTLFVLAAAVGSTLAVVPLRWVGLLAIAPWALAWRSWRHRRDESRESPRRGSITTFLITIGLGGDNLAVWIPLLRANGPLRDVALGVVFVLWQLLFVALTWAMATRPRVIEWGQRHGSNAIPWLYVGLGVAVLYECHVL